MSLYKNTVTDEVREFEPAFIASHPKGHLWQPYTPPVQPTPVPDFVTRRQLFLWLELDRGVPDAEGAIAGQIALLPDGETKRRAQIEFKTATEFRRDNPFVAQIGAALGLTPPEIDAGFILAASKYP